MNKYNLLIVNMIFVFTKIIQIRQFRLIAIVLLHWFIHIKKKFIATYAYLLSAVIIFSDFTIITPRVFKIIPPQIHVMLICIEHFFHILYVLWTHKRKFSDILLFSMLIVIGCIPSEINIYSNMHLIDFTCRVFLFCIMLYSIQRIKCSYIIFSKWLWIFFLNRWFLILTIPQLIIEIYY